MALTTEYKRLLLRSISWDAKDGGQSLADAIKSFARARLSTTSSGLIVQSTAANGHSVQFRLPAGSDVITPLALVEFAEEMLTRYDAAEAYLGGSPNDPSIVTEILAHLTPATESTSDYSTLRYASGATVI